MLTVSNNWCKVEMLKYLFLATL